jgi:TRAP transporter TAXI family solute receptor
MKKTVAALALSFCAGLALAGVAQAQQKQLAIGTGDPGGVYFPLGGAVASVLAKALPNLHTTVEVTGGSVDNIKLIATGQSDLGFTMADAAMEAMEGQGKFKNNKTALQTLLVVYPNRMHVVTTEGSGINTLADLKGKRVSTGSPGSATEIMAARASRPSASTRTRISSASGSASPSPPTPSPTAGSTRSSGSAASRPPRSQASPPPTASR